MNKKTKIKIFKITMFIIAIAICTGITIYLFPAMKQLATPEGQLMFKEKISNSGVSGFFLFF